VIIYLYRFVLIDRLVVPVLDIRPMSGRYQRFVRQQPRNILVWACSLLVAAKVIEKRPNRRTIALPLNSLCKHPGLVRRRIRSSFFVMVIRRYA
jgi:hypothetical protein